MLKHTVTKQANLPTIHSINNNSLTKSRNMTSVPRISRFSTKKDTAAATHRAYDLNPALIKTDYTTSSCFPFLSKLNTKSFSTNKDFYSTQRVMKMRFQKKIIDICDKIVCTTTTTEKHIKEGKPPEEAKSKTRRMSVVEARENIGSPEQIIEKIDNYYNSEDKDNFITTFYNVQRRKVKSSFESIKEKLNLKNFSTEKTHHKMFSAEDDEGKASDRYSIEHFLNKIVKQRNNILRRINGPQVN